MINFVSAAVLVAAAFASATSSQARTTAIIGQSEAVAVRQTVAAAMSVDHVPAYAISAVRGDRLIIDEAYGVANLETGTPATSATKFRIASVSKLFTATLAAQLAQEKRIDLDRDIHDYLPEWPDKHPAITLRQLLGHLAGVRHYIDRDTDFGAPGGAIDLRVYPDRASVLAVFANDDLVSAPGTKFLYSTFGFALAGTVLEAATKDKYFELLQKYVLEPARLSGVTLDHPFAVTADRAAPYDPIGSYEGLLPPSMGPVVNALPLNSTYKVAAGGLVARASDVARFGALHFAPGFLDRETFRQMFTPQRTAKGQFTNVGLGWERGTDEATRTYFFHTGSQQGSRAILVIYPKEKLSLAILTNLGNRPQAIRALALRAAQLLLRRPVEGR